ncbi:DNA-binding protein [Polymorphobacter arshaanensis]|uniref:DNA-binding protein n=1 Tax=Glacieibacterium arshaanense TaxID=2511025 RepID=A0A4Y9EJA5_9SPHN|nr:DNA-binding protein [Polymorphobacter arshaanensis]TFU00046.1 DNA-binding protein [Polymorphobacter arshaanensis]
MITEMVTAAEIAAQLKMSLTGFRSLLNERDDFPLPTSIGIRKKRWKLSDVNAWINAQ